MESKKHRGVCVRCSQLFSVRDPLNPRGPRCPRLLTCGHSLCEGCLRAGLQNSRVVTCPICNSKTPQKHDLNNLKEDFPINCFLLGHFAEQHRGKVPEDSKIVFIPAGNLPKNRHDDDDDDGESPEKKGPICHECSSTPANCTCEQCLVPYCSACFTKVHQSSRVLQRHSSRKLEAGGLHMQHSYPVPMCPEHSEQKLDFFCHPCNSITCPYCVICYHVGHEVSTRKSMNEERLGELDSAMETVTTVLDEISRSLELLQEYGGGSGHSSALLDAERAISRHFLFLHGMLQLQEAAMTARLRTAGAAAVRQASAAADRLAAVGGRLRALRRDARTVRDDPKARSVADVPELARQLRAAREERCRLLELPGAKLAPIFTVNHGLLAQLQHNCRLEIPPQESFHLVRMERPLPTPPPPVVDTARPASAGALALDSLPPLPPSPVTAVSPPESPQMQRRPPAVSLSGDGSSTGASLARPVPQRPVPQQPSAPAPTSTAPPSTPPAAATVSDAATQFLIERIPEKPFVAKGEKEVVTVCHVKDPSNFFVQRDCDYKTVANMEDILNISPERDAQPPTTVEIGKVYMAKFMVDNKWYRVCVRDIAQLNPPSSRDLMVDVHYIDYGNSETLQLSRLRPLPSQMVDVPALALHCTLSSLYPRNGHAWPDETIKTFVKMVFGARVHLQVMDFIDNMYHVDLCAIPGLSKSNFPVSCRDALVFLELGFFADRTKMNVRRASALYDTEYLQQEALVSGDIFDVLVSHIMSPSHFYVQRYGQHSNYLVKLLEDMNEHYAKTKDDLIYNPGVGMPCAAQFSLDKNWYRAQVIRIPKKGTVDVFYVDYGNHEVVSWKQLRRLQESFMRIPPQAVMCSLSDVVPLRGNNWLPDVTRYLTEITAQKALRLFVVEVSKACIKVGLYESQQDTDICINSLLVREHYAKSIGINSSLVEYHKVDTPLPDDSRNKVNQEIKQVTRMPRNLRNKGKHGGAAGDSLPQQPATRPRSSRPNPAGGYRVAVNVLASISPSRVYVGLCSNEEEIAQMTTALQEFYSESAPEPQNDEEWKVDDRCCVFLVKKKTWFRGVVEELKGEKAKVFLKDYAETEEVPLSALLPLGPEFRLVHDGAVCCHMVGVRAAGGSDQWPSLSCETLSELIAQHSELYITKKGHIENNSLPVELWAREMKSVGPLDPTVEVWINLNQCLVDQGVAIPVRCTDTNEAEANEAGLGLGFGEEESKEEEEEELEKAAAVNESLPLPLKRTLGAVCNGLQDSSSESDDGRCELVLESAGRDWLPSPPLRTASFVGIPTQVDYSAKLYIHDMTSEDTLKVVGAALNECMKNTGPKPQDLYWFEGQICIARYHLDKNWYRGKVLKVKENNHLEVMFVDYGNIEDCEAAELRKDVIMGQIPIQCRCYTLDDIVPATEDGAWLIPVLDFLHTQVVEKKCRIVVKSPLGNKEPHKISLTLPGNVDVAELLVSMHYALYSESLLKLPQEEDVASESSSVIVENEVEVEVVPQEQETAEASAKTKDINSCTKEGEKEEGDGEQGLTAETANGNLKVDSDVDNAGDNNTLKTEASQEAEIATTEGQAGKGTPTQTSQVSGGLWSDDLSEDLSEDEDSGEGKEQSPEDELKAVKCDQPEETVLKSNMVYKSLNLQGIDVFPAEVTAIITPTEVVIHPHVNTNEELGDKNDFVLMCMQLKDSAEYQPCIKEPYIGQPCCVPFETDGQWYRALVLQVEENQAQVEFVDYGNVEWVPRDRVRRIKAEWLAVPRRGLHCSLWQLGLPEKTNNPVLLQLLAKSLFEIPLVVRVKSLRPLSVELYPSSGNMLVYQPILDTGLMVQEAPAPEQEPEPVEQEQELGAAGEE